MELGNVTGLFLNTSCEFQAYQGCLNVVSDHLFVLKTVVVALGLYFIVGVFEDRVSVDGDLKEFLGYKYFLLVYCFITIVAYIVYVSMGFW